MTDDMRRIEEIRQWLDKLSDKPSFNRVVKKNVIWLLWYIEMLKLTPPWSGSGSIRWEE